MMRLNGSPSGDALGRATRWNVPWLSRPVRSSVRAADLHCRADLGVLERDRDLGGEELDELELVVAEWIGPAPSRSSVRTPTTPSGRAAARR